MKRIHFRDDARNDCSNGIFLRAGKLQWRYNRCAKGDRALLEMKFCYESDENENDIDFKPTGEVRAEGLMFHATTVKERTTYELIGCYRT